MTVTADELRVSVFSVRKKIEPDIFKNARNMPQKGQQLDLTSDANPGPTTGPRDRNRFLGIHFACCDVYSRVYANRDQTAYLGNCPGCAKRVEFQIGSGGTDSRFFKVS